MRTRKDTRKRTLHAVRADENATVSAIARRAGVPAYRVRADLDALVREGVVSVAGSKRTGKRGRPATLYRRAA